jgi:phospholipid/cholesterol/gamma-HCH transport system substrate-binding protein
MSNQHRGAEWKVGLFIAIGIIIITVMAVVFGKLGTGLQSFYDVKVEFPDASGLLKGAEVHLAGARIGFASEAPELVEGRYAVTVTLRIREGVKIPKNAKFIVDTSGIMGDAYVDISIPERPDTQVLANGAMVLGFRKEGMGDLMARGSGVMIELQKRLAELEDPIKNVRENLLSEANMVNLQKSFSNVREFTDSLKQTGKDLDEIVAKAKGAGGDLSEAMTAAKTAMAKIDGVVAKVDAAAAELKPALVSLKLTSDGAEKAVTNLRVLLTKANQGQGVLGLLLSDRETSDNLKAFIRNLKSKGILWYKDKPDAKP